MKKTWIIWGASLALAFVVGTVAPALRFAINTASAEDRYSDLQNFTKVLNLVQQYYVESVDSKKLIYGAIKGMLRELDPHTNFLTPEVFKDFETETSGEFGGIGIEISVQNSVLTIISPIEDTPAWEAGIKPGDRVIAIDGKSTKGLSLVEASQLMKGRRGSKIVLTIVREGEDDPRDIGIVRGSVKIRSVKATDLEDGYMYVKITSFIENTGRDLEKALTEAQKKYGGVKGLILDLRRNPGGLLDQAVKVSDLFLKEGDTIVSTIGRDPKNKEVLNATKRNKFDGTGIIVLMNEYSASASEIVAGALQDNKRAIVMGEKSFGKGSVQSVIKLGDGSGLKLTVARYYTPSGKSIQAEGITPDLAVEEVDVEAFQKAIIKGKGTREKDIAGHLLSEKEKEAAKKSVPNAKVEAWWKDAASKKDENRTPKEKLLATDYQAYQAFNYLKAWKLMKGM
ncbi:MAG: S41 family peptidase [Bdellovibrionaceae bacterium]|nr:S41 family peptidase [Pseudobdellovibrionaceae bacterium]